MPLKIAIDARRVRDFGIGTYIRNLIQGLAKLDRSNQYVLVTLPSEVQHLKRLPANFETVTYPKPDSDARGQLQFPFFLKSLRASLCHIPVNRVPLTMMGTYVVTIHDMSSLLFGDRSGLRLSYRRFEFRRGLSRAARVIAVSAATQRDVQEQFGVPEERIRKVYSAPDPEFFRHRHSADARAPVRKRKSSSGPAFLSATRFIIHSCCGQVISACQRTCRAWWRPSPWLDKSWRVTRNTRTYGSF